jgi:hypothetical protein
VEWITLKYPDGSEDKEYVIRCDVDSKANNFVPPHTIGWALAELNPVLRERKDLHQQAMTAWWDSKTAARLRGSWAEI